MNKKQFEEAEKLLDNIGILQRRINLLIKAKGYCREYDRYVVLAVSKHVNFVENSISFLAFPEIEEAIDKAIERMKKEKDEVEKKFEEL